MAYPDHDCARPGWNADWLWSVLWQRFGRAQGEMALGTGQRNLAAALLVAAGSFDEDTFVMTMVAAVTLTIVMHIVAAEWGRHNGAGAADS